MNKSKSTFRQLNTKQKLQYIWDYYKIHIIATAVIICITFSIISTVRKNTTADLYMGYINVATTDSLTGSIASDCHMDIYNYNDLLITADPDSDNIQYAYGSSIKLMSAISDDKLDIIIADSYGIGHADDLDYLTNPADFLSEMAPELLKKYEPYFVYNIDGRPYAIDVSSISPFKEANYTAPVYLGIIASDNNRNNAIVKLLYTLIKK